ncbi:hypothetical protein AB1Y20_009624 [Prymnesium parvum]
MEDFSEALLAHTMMPAPDTAELVLAPAPATPLSYDRVEACHCLSLSFTWMLLLSRLHARRCTCSASHGGGSDTNVTKLCENLSAKEVQFVIAVISTSSTALLTSAAFSYWPPTGLTSCRNISCPPTRLTSCSLNISCTHDTCNNESYY